jgi:hypothetical protein
MRRLAILLLLAATPAFAQTPPAPTPPFQAPPAGQGAAGQGAAGQGAARQAKLQERFDAANTTHDGHLTQAQADAAKWTYVSKHFSVIDKDHKGYVTVDDIKAYAHAARSAKHNVPVGKTSPTPATTN